MGSNCSPGHVNGKDPKKSIRIHTRTLLVSAVLALPAAQAADTPPAPRLKLGAYYFAGWSGKSPYDDGSVSNAWAKGMPTHFTKKLGTEFAGRTPVWGWREDTPGVLERQIDLAADHGLAFFAYCWYFKDAEGKALDLETIYPFKLLADWNASVWASTSRPAMPYIPVATQGWDRRPWEATNGEGLGKGSKVSPHFARGTPEEFEAYIRRMQEWMDANPEQTTPDRLGLIYAWNEIGEGGWLVPCRDDPDGAYLKAIRRVVYGK